MVTGSATHKSAGAPISCAAKMTRFTAKGGPGKAASKKEIS
jgi:hypothetical protein